MIGVADQTETNHTHLPDPAAGPTRLLLVDDHAAVRAGLRQLLDDEWDFEVVAALPPRSRRCR